MQNWDQASDIILEFGLFLECCDFVLGHFTNSKMCLAD